MFLPRLVRFGFDLLYHQAAFTYDAVSWFVSLGAWRAWQMSALWYLPPPSAGAVLELAHGTGHVQQALRRLGYQAFGLDLSSQMGRIAQKRLACDSLLRASALQLPFADGAFSSVLTTFPTAFIFTDDAQHEIMRVLRPSGTFIAVLNGVLLQKHLLARIVEGLYWATGQRTTEEFIPSRYLPHLQDATLVQVRLSTSEVQLVVFQKQA